MNDLSLKDLIDQRFAADSKHLPVFNAVAMELQRLKESRKVSARQMADVILRDQALAGRILQVANSSFYGGLRQVDTLSGAVMRLGINRIASLAMVAAQLNAHSTTSKRFAALMPKLWLRSFASAVGARWIATETGHESQAEEAFLAGLLHDVGELFLLKVLDNIDTQGDDAQIPPITKRLVAEALASLHNDIGYRLMREWQLPDSYARIARDHHHEDFDEGDTLLAIVRLMDIVCLKMGIGQEPEPDIALAATREASALEIREIKLAQLEILIEDTLDEARSML